MKYVSVVVDNNTNATDELYTYKSESDEICVGAKLSVPFGIHNRITDGYCVKISEQPPEGIKRIKSILKIEEQFLSEEAAQTALWIRNRYLCRYIEAVKLFLPVNTEAKRKTKDPFENIEAAQDSPKELNKGQKSALSAINTAIVDKRCERFLLHGVTGSGKTEVYLQAMQKCIECGRQGIILVPEIALTPQTVGRFVARFGKDAVAVIHSKLTPQQKSVEYKKISEGKVKLVIGARSAIFAPFESIGLIVIDEEHESSYKSDKSPKYDGIEVAVKRAINHNAVLVLGSATPSIVSYYRSESGVYKRLEMPERYNSNPLPFVEICDMAEEIRSGNRNIFSVKLADEMKNQLEKGRQVILFLNRRGYSSYVSCIECDFVQRCPECGISMTYHKAENACVCHYCGRKIQVPYICPKCGSKHIRKYGSGTEQLEETAKALFPEASVDRLDLDTISKKGSLESVLGRFAKKKTNILIGTQIVAKGLDFANVGLVGIVNADVSLNIPDFRSAERTFQLVTQASGRSGRGNEPGKVIIQTSQPENYALLCSADNNYKAFYEQELSVRELSGYPPFSDIFALTVMDKEADKAKKSAERCSSWLRKKLGPNVSVLGPAAGVLRKEDGRHRYQILIKSPQGMRKEISASVLELKKKYAADKDTAEIFTIDINPYSFI